MLSFFLQAEKVVPGSRVPLIVIIEEVKHCFLIFFGKEQIVLGQVGEGVVGVRLAPDIAVEN